MKKRDDGRSGLIQAVLRQLRDGENPGMLARDLPDRRPEMPRLVQVQEVVVILGRERPLPLRRLKQHMGIARAPHANLLNPKNRFAPPVKCEGQLGRDLFIKEQGRRGDHALIRERQAAEYQPRHDRVYMALEVGDRRLDRLLGKLVVLRNPGDEPRKPRVARYAHVSRSGVMATFHSQLADQRPDGDARIANARLRRAMAQRVRFYPSPDHRLAMGSLCGTHVPLSPLV